MAQSGRADVKAEELELQACFGNANVPAPFWLTPTRHVV